MVKGKRLQAASIFARDSIMSEELDASVPEKLSKHSLENDSLKDSSSINFLFTNCSKLMSEEANKKNLVDSQIRIQHMVIASLRLFKV